MKNNPYKSGLKFLSIFLGIAAIVLIASQTFWGSIILFTGLFIGYIFLLKYLKKKQLILEQKIIIPKTLEEEIFNVDTFNEWYNDPNNGAEYAHKGIFLRIDKLSYAHIQDYIKTKFGIINDDVIWSISEGKLFYDFVDTIKKDWREKQKERYK